MLPPFMAQKEAGRGAEGDAEMPHMPLGVRIGLGAPVEVQA